MVDLSVDIHTDDARLRELCELYWSRDDDGGFPYKVKELAAHFDVPPQQIPQLAAQHSTARLVDDRCAGCGEGRVVRHRSDISERLWTSGYSWRCPRCQAEGREEQARAAREEQERRRLLIEDVWSGRPDGASLDVERLGLEEACALLALIRVGATEDLARVKPREAWPERLTPTSDLDMALLDELFAKRLLDVDPSSDIAAFDWTGRRPDRFYLAKVQWLAPGPQHVRPLGGLARELDEIFRTSSWPRHWHSDVDAVWRRLALHECLAYLSACMDELQLPLRAGDETRLVVEHTLERFSIGQTFSFIWRAAGDAAAYNIRSGVPKQQAANAVVGGIQLAAERALAEGWDVEALGRGSRVPESVLSAVFFRAALRLSDPLGERSPDAARSEAFSAVDP